MTRDMPVVPVDRWVESAAGTRLHVVDWRVGAEPVLLCLHGITANARAFDGLARALWPEHAVIAPDLRGRGESDAPEGPYGVATHAADALVLLDTLGIARVPVAGWSLGALVALQLAASAPERISRVALLDPPLAALSDAAQASLGRVQTRLAREYASVDEALAAARALDYLAGNWDAAIEAYLRADLQALPDGRVRHRMRPETLVAERAAPLPSLPRIVPRVRCPVLILRAPGALSTPGDQVLGERAAARAARLFADARTLDIPATNHYTILLGAPAATTAAIRDFLTEGEGERE